MRMRKLAFYEFGCRNILYLMFESFSIYYLYQKRLAEAICYSEIVKPNILLRKLKQRKKIKEKKVCVYVCVWNTSVKMADGGKICRHPFLSLIYKCAGLSINRAEWLHETSWLGQPSWIVFQKRASTAKRANSLSA